MSLSLSFPIWKMGLMIELASGLYLVQHFVQSVPGMKDHTQEDGPQGERHNPSLIFQYLLSTS